MSLPLSLSDCCRTKLAGEKEVACRWPRHAILRAGPLFGPPPPAPLASSTPWLQQLDADLADKVRWPLSQRFRTCLQAGGIPCVLAELLCQTDSAWMHPERLPACAAHVAPLARSQQKPVLAATDEVCTPTYTEDLLRAIRKVCARQEGVGGCPRACGAPHAGRFNARVPTTRLPAPR